MSDIYLFKCLKLFMKFYAQKWQKELQKPDYRVSFELWRLHTVTKEKTPGLRQQSWGLDGSLG